MTNTGTEGRAIRRKFIQTVITIGIPFSAKVNILFEASKNTSQLLSFEHFVSVMKKKERDIFLTFAFQENIVLLMKKMEPLETSPYT